MSENRKGGSAVGEGGNFTMMDTMAGLDRISDDDMRRFRANLGPASMKEFDVLDWNTRKVHVLVAGMSENQLYGIMAGAAGGGIMAGFHDFPSIVRNLYRWTGDKKFDMVAERGSA